MTGPDLKRADAQTTAERRLTAREMLRHRAVVMRREADACEALARLLPEALDFEGEANWLLDRMINKLF